MKVLLIEPQGFGAGLNLGLGYLAGVLLANNHEVRVVDCNNTPERLAKGPRMKVVPSSRRDWVAKIDRGLKWQPEVIGISITTFTLVNALQIIEYCRSKWKSVYIAGGPHVTMLPKHFMEKHHDLFDFAIVGEGEETIVDLLNNMSRPERVKGIVYSDASKQDVVQTERRSVIEDLDCLPFPEFSVFDSVDIEEGLFNYQLITSRGCPYKCVFCLSGHLWTNRWRARSPESVLEELKCVIEKHRIKNVTIWDDNFTLDISRAKEICQRFISEGLKLEYSLAGVRADRLDEELVELLRKSGCSSISIGVEDGDPDTFPLVQKGESLEDIERAINLIKESGISVQAYMVIGLKNSSYNSFLRSLDFLEKLKVSAHWMIAVPFPNTDLYRWVEEKGRFLLSLEQGLSQSTTAACPPVFFDTPDFSKDDRLKAYCIGNLRCKGYDMLLSSRNSNIFSWAVDIAGIIWKYDRQRSLHYFFDLFRLFLSSVWSQGRIKI